MENEIENANSTNSNEEVVETKVENTQVETEESTETVEVLKQKNQELYEQLRKAQGYVRGEDGKWIKKSQPQAVERKSPQTESKPQGMSTTDLIALMNAKVNEEDISEVENYAKFKGISVAEALKTSVVKTLLSEKEEMRKTANATNVKGSRVGSSKATPADLLSKARTGGQVDDFEALALARLEERKNANKR